MDVPTKLMYQFPALYKIGRERELFNVKFILIFIICKVIVWADESVLVVDV